MTPHPEFVVPPAAAFKMRRAPAYQPATMARAPATEPDEGGWATSIDLTPPRRWVRLLAYATLAAWLAAEYLVRG